MLRLGDVLLAAALVVIVAGLFVQAQPPKPNPCKQRLETIAKEMTRLWHDPIKGKVMQGKVMVGMEMKGEKGDKQFERFLKTEVKEPLTCPVLNTPYLILPEELSKQWQLPILLSDPKPHPDKHRFAITISPDPSEKELKFIATSLPPPREVQQRFVQARAKAQAASCLSNLRNVGVALAMYVQDHDGNFPPMRVVAQTQKALYPYLRNWDIFNCPATKKPYQPNPHLHLKRLKEIPKPFETPAFYDPQPHPDGMRGVVFVDGHSRMLSPKEWQSLQKHHKLPKPR